MDLKFTVTRQYIRRIDTNRVVANSKNYLTAVFIFSEEWEGINKTAIFSHGGKNYGKLLKNDECIIPPEVIQADEFTVSVFGGDLVTTNVCFVNVISSGLPCGKTPTTTPDIYSQILDIAINAQDTAIEAMDLVQSLTPEGMEELRQLAIQASEDSQQAIKTADEAKSLVTDAKATADEAYSLASSVTNIATDAKTTALSANSTALEAKTIATDTRAYVDEIAKSLTGFKIQIVQALPEVGSSNMIYLVAKAKTEDLKDIYDEYIWTGSGYELIGSTNIDLSNYYNKAEVDARLQQKASGSDVIQLRLDIDKNKQSIEDQKLLVDNAVQTATDAKTKAEEALAKANEFNQEELQQIKATATNAYTIAEQAKTSITELQPVVTQIDTDVQQLQLDIEGISTNIEQLQTNVQQITQTADDAKTTATEAKQLAQDTKDYVDELLAGGVGIKIQVVETLPETGEDGIIYLVPNDKRTTDDVYEEYIWVNDKYELIGTTSQIELTNYYTKGEVDGLLSNKVDTEQLQTQLDTKADKTELTDVVKYKDFVYNEQTRKTIELANNNTISGVDTSGQGYNLLMVSQYDIADFGSQLIHLNLNSVDNVTLNDDKVLATTDQLEDFVTSADLDDVVKYVDLDSAKGIQLQQTDKIVGNTTTSEGVIDVISTTDKLNIGDEQVSLNLNTKDVITINGTDVIATTEDIDILDEEITQKLNDKQDKLTAGSNITIIDNVISAVGGEGGTTDYTALINKPQINSVELTGNLTLEDLSIASIEQLQGKQDTLVAGSGINIEGNVISTTGGGGSDITKLSELENDVGFVTGEEVDEKLAQVSQFKVQVVNELPPAPGDTKTIYLVPKDGTTSDVYNEYLYIENTNRFELIGSTAVDLSNYATKTYVTDAMGLIEESLSTVATTGNYEDLSNKPHIPTAVGDLDNDSGFVTQESLSVFPTKGEMNTAIQNYNELYPASLNQNVVNDIGGFKAGDSLTGLTLAQIIEKILTVQPGTVDKTKLLEAITAAEEYTDSSIYTPTSWQAFQTALQNANTEYLSEESTDETVQQATQQLNDAIGELTLLKEVPVPVIQNTQNESSVALTTKEFTFPVTNTLTTGTDIEESKVSISGAEGSVTVEDTNIKVTITSDITSSQEVTIQFQEGVVTNTGDGQEYKSDTKVSVSATKLITYATEADPFGSYVWKTGELVMPLQTFWSTIEDEEWLQPMINDWETLGEDAFWQLFDAGKYELHVLRSAGDTEGLTNNYEQIINAAGTSQEQNLPVELGTAVDWFWDPDNVKIEWSNGVQSGVFVLLRRN